MLLVLLELGCHPRKAGPPPELAREWMRGPVRWLLSSEERARARRVGDAGELQVFVRNFWARRKDLAGLFHQRVRAADRLYGEEGKRGALTDRGGVLILLGPPDRMRIGETTVPARFRRDGRGSRTRRVPSERWIYRRENLRPRLVTLLRKHGHRGDVELLFLQEARGTRLAEGREILRLAARSWVHPPGLTDR